MKTIHRPDATPNAVMQSLIEEGEAMLPPEYPRPFTFVVNPLPKVSRFRLFVEAFCFSLAAVAVVFLIPRRRR